MYNPKICVVGLGYVGLPLAIELAKYFDVTGFDINESRINTLISGLILQVKPIPKHSNLLL